MKTTEKSAERKLEELQTMKAYEVEKLLKMQINGLQKEIEWLRAVIDKLVKQEN